MHERLEVRKCRCESGVSCRSASAHGGSKPSHHNTRTALRAHEGLRLYLSWRARAKGLGHRASDRPAPDGGVAVDVIANSRSRQHLRCCALYGRLYSRALPCRRRTGAVSCQQPLIQIGPAMRRKTPMQCTTTHSKIAPLKTKQRHCLCQVPDTLQPLPCRSHIPPPGWVQNLRFRLALNCISAQPNWQSLRLGFLHMSRLRKTKKKLHQQKKSTECKMSLLCKQYYPSYTARQNDFQPPRLQKTLPSPK